MKTYHFLSSSLSVSALVLLILSGDIWRMLLTPLLWVAAMLFFLLAGRSMLQSWSMRKQWNNERIEWGAPPPSLSQRWRVKMGRIRFRLLESAKRRTQAIAPKPMPPAPSTASAQPLKKPSHQMLSLFNVPNSEAKERFAWDEHDSIE